MYFLIKQRKPVFYEYINNFKDDDEIKRKILSRNSCIYHYFHLEHFNVYMSEGDASSKQVCLLTVCWSHVCCLCHHGWLVKLVTCVTFKLLTSCPAITLDIRKVLANILDIAVQHNSIMILLET